MSYLTSRCTESHRRLITSNEWARLANGFGDRCGLERLHNLGADPAITTVDGVTPVIAAARLGTLAAGEVAGTEEEVIEALEWLVAIGQDVNAVDKNGETAMHAAAYKNLPESLNSGRL